VSRRCPSPAGPIILRDHPPGWRVELYDWTFQQRNQFEIPGPASRLEYLLRGLTVGENETLFLHGDGEDFLHIYRWSGELKAEFHQDGRLRSLSSDGYRLQLSPNHDSGSASSGDLEQRYYANGTVEQFSSMDDNSEPHPVPFQDWVQRWLADILGP
jgi:hypothetical protein